MPWATRPVLQSRDDDFAAEACFAGNSNISSCNHYAISRPQISRPWNNGLHPACVAGYSAAPTALEAQLPCTIFPMSP